MRLFLLCVLFGTCKATVNYSLGVIAADDTHVFCVTFKPSWFTESIPRTRDTAIPHALYHAPELNGCITPLQGQFQDKGVVIVDSGSCEVEDRVRNVVDVGGAGLLVIGRVFNQLNVTKVKSTNFSTVPVVLVNSNSLKTLLQLPSDNISLTFYTPYPSLDGKCRKMFFHFTYLLLPTGRIIYSAPMRVVYL